MSHKQGVDIKYVATEGKLYATSSGIKCEVFQGVIRTKKYHQTVINWIDQPPKLLFLLIPNRLRFRLSTYSV